MTNKQHIINAFKKRGTNRYQAGLKCEVVAVLVKIAHDEPENDNEWHRQAVSSNSFTIKKTLGQLAKSDSWSVRWIVAQNPRCPKTALFIIFIKTFGLDGKRGDFYREHEKETIRKAVFLSVFISTCKWGIIALPIWLLFRGVTK